MSDDKVPIFAFLGVAGVLAMAACTRQAPPATVEIIGPCLVIGDSIASRWPHPGGLGGLYPDCYVNAIVGRPSEDIVKAPPPFRARFTVVSTGSNDHDGKTYSAAETIRRKLAATRSEPVIWVLPSAAHASARSAVEKIARDHGDATVDFEAGPDGTHPRSYAALAEGVNAVLKSKGIEP